MSDFFDPSEEMLREICEDYAGHEWVDAGGGMKVCMRCQEMEEGDIDDE